jgi:hypothetical protein
VSVSKGIVYCQECNEREVHYAIQISFQELLIKPGQLLQNHWQNYGTSVVPLCFVCWQLVKSGKKSFSFINVFESEKK